VKNVEETVPPALKEVKEESNPENTLVEKDEVDDVDSVYEDTPTTYRRATALEACLMITPLILGIFYSYVVTSLIYDK
jgi:hypothetical protein